MPVELTLSETVKQHGSCINLEVANTPGNHLQSTEPTIDYMHRLQDVKAELYGGCRQLSTLREFNRICGVSKLCKANNEAFVSEVVI